MTHGCRETCAKSRTTEHVSCQVSIYARSGRDPKPRCDFLAGKRSLQHSIVPITFSRRRRSRRVVSSIEPPVLPALNFSKAQTRVLQRFRRVASADAIEPSLLSALNFSKAPTRASYSRFRRRVRFLAADEKHRKAESCRVYFPPSPRGSASSDSHRQFDVDARTHIRNEKRRENSQLSASAGISRSGIVAVNRRERRASPPPPLPSEFAQHVRTVREIHH